MARGATFAAARGAGCAAAGGRSVAVRVQENRRDMRAAAGTRTPTSLLLFGLVLASWPSVHAQDAVPVPAAALPPASPAARIASQQQFLLFDVIFHEQVNKQRRAFMFFLDLAMKLKRVLVLPRPRLLRRLQRAGSHFDKKADYVAWGELFNVSALAKVHPVMELEQYLALHGGVGLHVRISHKDCAPIDEETRFEFNGVPDVVAARTICHNKLQYTVNALAAKPYAEIDAIAFSNSVDQVGPHVALPLRPYVRFEQSVYDTAADFVRASFDGEAFLAIHWRRTDFLHVRRSHQWALQSAPMLIRHARALMREHGLRHVYLATDSEDASEIAEVQAALQPARYTGNKRTLLAKTVTANVEIAICAMANRFLGTRTSSFTLAITEERAGVFGHEQWTGDEMGEPPPELERAKAKDEL